MDLIVRLCRWSSRKITTATSYFDTLWKKNRRKTCEELPGLWRVELYGEPGDRKLNEPVFWDNFESVMESLNVPWCITEEHVLLYYKVPRACRDFHICVRDEDYATVTEAFDNAEFCHRTHGTINGYSPELKDCPRYKVHGERPCFMICPSDTTQGSLSLEENDLIPTSVTKLPYPMPTLPSFILSALNGRGSNLHKGSTYIEELVHGVDLDEEWCRKYMVSCTDEQKKKMHNATTSETKKRVMTHPKHWGMITLYIADNEELSIARSTPGRDPTVIPRVKSPSVLTSVC